MPCCFLRGTRVFSRPMDDSAHPANRLSGTGQRGCRPTGSILAQLASDQNESARRPVGWVSSLACEREGAAHGVTVEGNRHDQDEAGGNRLPEGRNAEEVERVGDDAEQEHADDGAAYLPAAAAERGTA